MFVDFPDMILDLADKNRMPKNNNSTQNQIKFCVLYFINEEGKLLYRISESN